MLHRQLIAAFGVSISVLALCLGAANAEEFPNTLGWEWKIAPHEPASFFAAGGLIIISETGPNNEFLVTFAHQTNLGDVRQVQIVAFDKGRRPYRLTPRQGGAQNAMDMHDGRIVARPQRDGHA
jgi:hypothetical protein